MAILKIPVTVGNLPTSFLESMSYYEALNFLMNEINRFDTELTDAIQYMKTNIKETATEIFNEYLESGVIQIALDEDYDSTTESLTLSIAAVSNE